MDELATLYYKFHIELYKNYLFFLPSEHLPDEFIIEIVENLGFLLTEEELDEISDEILLLDENIDIKILKSLDYLHEFLNQKMILLSNNSFQLIKLKAELDVESYNYIFNKYMEQLSYFEYVNNILVEKFNEYFEEFESSILRIFKFQKTIFENHLKEIESQVGIKSTQINSNDLIKNIDKFNKRTKSKPEIVPFKNFIKHENKEKIEELIKLHFSELSGVSLRNLLEYLKEKKVLVLGYGDVTKIYNSIILLFDGKNIGATTSIFDKKIFKNDENYKNLKVVFDEIIGKYIY